MWYGYCFQLIFTSKTVFPKISPKKCQWIQTEVRFLGFLVSGDGIRLDPEKVKVIKEWKAPETVKQSMRFLGFCAFYHRFLENLVGVAQPLYGLLKKNIVFQWTEEADKAFNQLKVQIMTLPILAFPDPSLGYELHCDASDTILRAIAVQGGRPIAFASRTLAPAERNYHTTEKECLAIVQSLEYFNPYIYGANLVIYTDRAALKAILSTKTPRGRITRWIMILQSYAFTVIHKKGELNQYAVALSKLNQNAQESLVTMTLYQFRELQKADPHIKLILKEGVKEPFTSINNALYRKLTEETVTSVLSRLVIASALKQAQKKIAIC